jgi:hypothetical protein
MMICAWVGGGLIVLVLGLFIYLYTGVARGARKRDERVLREIAPVGERLFNGEAVPADEIRALAARPHLRWLLYQMLKKIDRVKDFPAEFTDRQAQAEAVLAYWMLHPNELQDPPESMELAAIERREVLGVEGDFYVFRYLMPEGHWAGREWLLGLAGPFCEKDAPYEFERAGGFSRCGDKSSEVKPAQLVDWYVGMLEKKNG